MKRHAEFEFPLFPAVMEDSVVWYNTHTYYAGQEDAQATYQHTENAGYLAVKKIEMVVIPDLFGIHQLVAPMFVHCHVTTSLLPWLLLSFLSNDSYSLVAYIHLCLQK